MKETFQKAILFLFLIPVFFVAHGYNENFGLISIRDVCVLLLTYLGGTLLLFLMFFLFFKNSPKAALVTSYIMCFYFFFGALHDFFKYHHILLHKYSIILPLFTLTLIATIVYLKKSSKNNSALILFLNTLLITYLIVDFSGIVWKAVRPTADRLSVYQFARNNSYQPCKACKKPDIYLLLFDEYGSSVSLKERFRFDNSNLDSFLISNGFDILKHSHSNYNITAFSMASILNMSYLKGIKDPKACTIEDFAFCQNLIRKNEVIKFLSAQGYDIINHSVFELAGSPSEVDQSFLPLKTKLISDRTLWEYLQNDIGWEFYTGRFKVKWLAEKLLLRDHHNNNFLLGQVKKESALYNGRPRFIYGHFYMPHPPFFCDSTGRLRTSEELKNLQKKDYASQYLQYVQYTNTKIKELIQTIKQNTHGTAVIVFMGDHGFRQTTNPGNLFNYFQNQNAVYFPGHDYAALPDSICTVNEFRIIFNTMFDAHLPLLNDSTIFLTNTYKFSQ